MIEPAEALRARLEEHLGGDPQTIERDRLVARLREFIDAERERLAHAYHARPTGVAYANEHSALFDAVIAIMYRVATAAVAERRGPCPEGEDVCVAAVGGYGRGRLSPWSDIDLAFIPSREAHEHLDAIIREMLHLLADVLVPGRHPRVAHSYRPISDLPLIDHQTATALLESRPIAGSNALHGRFMDELMESIDPVEFFHLNRSERESVWSNPRQSLYAVEPDIKSGPGGLRDFHAGVWIGKVVFNIKDWDVLAVLRWRGVISEQERVEALRALEFMNRCRNWLHLERGQKLDTLHFDYLSRMAEALGYESNKDRVGAELLMHDYYLNARVLWRFGRRLFEAAKRQRLNFADALYVDGWTLYADHDGIFFEDPGRLVKVFEYRQRLGLNLSAPLQRLIAEQVELLDEAVRRRPDVGASFLEILRSPLDVAGTLREMLALGVLEQLLPEFAPLMLFLPSDPAHEYSVGEHSLKVLEDIQRVRDNPSGETDHILSDAIRSLQEPEVLFFTALFHDVGKLDGTGEHSLTGIPVARLVAQRLGMQDSSIDRVEFLIREHLSMMRTARLAWTALPETIAEFAGLLPDHEPLDALDMLTVLTYCDTRMVGQNVLRDADRHLLMDLFTKTSKWVQEQPLRDAPVSRERAERRLRTAPVMKDRDPDAVRRHLDRLPTWYAVNTPPALIAKHMDYIERAAGGEQPVVEFYHALGTRHTDVTLVTIDRPGLLRDIAAAVTANNLDIYLVHLDICAGVGEPAWSIATVWVDDFGQPLGPPKRDRLREDLTRVFTDGESAEDLLARRGKVVKQEVVLHKVEVSTEASPLHTVVTVRAGDQRGLLYRLTDALLSENVDIRMAKVTTWRGAAEDAFYVVSRDDGRPLDDDEARALAERLTARLREEPAEVT